MKVDFTYSIDLVRKILYPKNIFEFGENFFFTSITTSSKEAEKSSLFIPLQGARDGHEFIEDAIESGASFYLCQVNHPILKRLSKQKKEKAILVKEPLYALGELARFHRMRFRPLVIAITGSSGKTTTKELLGQCLSVIGEKNIVITEKNYNNEIGLPFTLFKISENTRIVVCEIGMNHFGEIERLSKIAMPDISVIASIGSAHIENLKTLQGVAKAKAEILEGMKDGGLLFLNSKENFFGEIKNKAKEKKVQLVSVKKNNQKILKVISKHENGFTLKLFGEKFTWNILGEKNLENLNLVLHVIDSIRFPKDQILHSISNFQSPDKRFIIEKKYFTVINDTYNANLESMTSSIDSARQLAGKNKLYAVLGDMKELGKFSKKYHLEIGKVCKERNLNGLITFGLDSQFMLQEFQKKNGFEFSAHFTNHEQSIQEIEQFLKNHLPPKSIILVKGSRSLKMERITEELAKIKF